MAATTIFSVATTFIFIGQPSLPTLIAAVPKQFLEKTRRLWGEHATMASKPNAAAALAVPDAIFLRRPTPPLP